MIHIAITYAEDGTITITATENFTELPIERVIPRFLKQETIAAVYIDIYRQVVIECYPRESTMQLYDYALSANEIQDSFVAAGKGINRKLSLATSADEQNCRTRKYNSKNSELVKGAFNL